MKKAENNYTALPSARRAWRFGLLLVMLFLSLLAPIVHAASTYRQAIEVNSANALTDFQVLVIIDTASLVTAGKMKADGGDIRFTDSDGLTPLPFWIENVSTYVVGAGSVSSMNTSATRIWVRVPSIPINPPDPRKIIHMFYGDPTAVSVANGADTFLFFDDFSGGLGKWTIHKQPAPGNISIIGGYLNCGGGFAGGDYGHTVIGSVNSYNTFTNGVIEGLIYMTANSIAEISYRGNFPNNTGYKVRWDQRPNEGMGFLKPPYFTASWRFWDGSGSGVINVSKDGIGFTTGYWFPFKVAANGNTVKINQGATVYSCTDAGTWSPPAPSSPVVNLYPGPGEISLQNHYGVWCRYDDIRVRRIAVTEPTTVLLGQGNLIITRIDASQPTVNRGQSGVSISMQIDNFSGESVNFLGGSLLFSLGNYTQTLIAPPIGTVIPPSGRITASFSVDVLPDSPLGDAIIDGSVITSGLVNHDGAATVKGDWTIQNPPALIIDQITASSTAYRGEVNRRVLVKVRNAGDATAYWDSSTLQFTLGDYTAVYPQTAFPIQLLGGASATALYGVDISPNSPVGTSVIDAEIAGSDGNTLYPILVSGALLPSEWHIPEEYLRTYQDTYYFNPLQTFNLPKVGLTYVYAQAQGLTPFTEYVVRWLNPSGTQVAFSNPPITSNASGILAHKYPLGTSSPTGEWTVRLTNPLNTKTFCESHFQLVGGASLSIILALPPAVSVGQTFSSTMTFINSGETALINARPGTIATSGTGLATLVSGPFPDLQDVPAHAQATFTWTWTAQAAGTFGFSGMGYGWDANSLERHTAPPQVGGGSGGLRADYFDNQNFTGAQLVRLDPMVDFNWGAGSPDPSMGANTFSVRWTGWVMPEFSENYTFFTNTNDGARLWINGVLLVDKWVDQSAEWSGSLALAAGEKYPITMEFYEKNTNALAQLSWSSPSTPKAIVPAGQLFSPPLVEVLKEAEALCVIQTPPNISILSVTAMPAVVFRNQNDIEVEAIVQNSGEVTAEIMAASLTFTFGNHTQTVATPLLPQYLVGNNSTVSIKFKVGVNLASPFGASDISCNIFSRDTNVPTSVSWLHLALPKDSWNISQHGLTISAFPAYTPPQSTFNRGQTLYIKGFFRASGLQGRIRLYNAQLAYTTPAPGGAIVSSGLLTADASGNLLTTYTLLPAATVGTWTAFVEDNAGLVLGIHHFAVTSMGNLVAGLTLSPSEVAVGATFTAELSVKNTVPGGSTISPAAPWPLFPTGASTGSAILLSGPTPAQISVSGASPGTFTWVFEAVEDTGALGSYSLTASYTTPQAYRRSLSVSSAVTLTNHQVRLTVNTLALVGAGKMRADCADIRFRDSDSQTELPYWLESGANTANTVLWVKVPAITANIPKIIYLYYGNPTAVSSSNGDAVFEFFDHFTTLDSSVWDRTGTNSVAGTSLTITTGAVISRVPVSSQDGMAVEASVRWTNFAGYSGLAISNFQNDKINNNPGSHKLVNLMTNNANSNSVRARAANGTAASYNITAGGTVEFAAVAGTSYIIGHAIFGGQVRILQDRAILHSYAGTWTGPFYVWLGHITGSQAGGTDISDLVVDWVLVRKFANPEPGVAIGNEEAPTQFPLLSGIDVSTGYATDSNSGISNHIYIKRQRLTLSSDVMDLGTISCGNTGSIGNTTASNTGNSDLAMVRWHSVDLESAEGNIIDKTNLFFSPDPVGPIAFGARIPASITLSVPFLQASGTYVASMAIFEDVNGNMVRDLGGSGEPVDFFAVRVVVPESQKIKVVEDLVDLGNWEIGMTTSAKPLQAFNAGNLSLNHLEFQQVVGTNTFPISINPATGTVATEAFLFADVVATLTVGPADTYIATWTLWNDTNADHVIDAGEASDSFQVRIGVGVASLTLTPSALDFGICSPAVTISQQVNLKNTGQVHLDNLNTVLSSLQDGAGNAIATDQVSLMLPVTTAPGITHIATISLFVPSGTISGTYTGEQWVYEDRNSNGTWDSGEASASLTLTVVVPSVRRVEVFANAVDMGSIIPGTTQTLALDCRNIGNTALTGLRWEKTNLQDGALVFAALNASFPTSEPFAVATGAFFSRDFQFSVPPAQASGTYFSVAPHYWLFNDDNLDTVRSTGEPEDTFPVKCQIGWWKIDILGTTLISSGDPSLPSTAVSFSVKSTGDLDVANARATASVLVPVVAGPPDIPGEASLVEPLTFGTIAPNQTKPGTWQVSVPNGCIAGDYSGTLTVWDDRNGNAQLDVNEVRDTIGITLTVNSKRVIKVMQNPLNLGWTLSGTTVEGAFEVVNVGNVPLTKAMPLASMAFNMGNSIPASNISFSINPLGFMAVGDAKIATVTLIVGWPRADGTYRGYQRVFDDRITVDNNYSPGEESCLFELIVSIGYKKLSVTNPVAFGNQNPGQTVTQGFSVKNETTVPLTGVKWLKGQLESGPHIIPAASLTFVPAGPIGIGGSTSRACSAKIVLGSGLPPGNYIGTHTAWEDNNGDGMPQPSEASATFNTTITVNLLPDLDILSASVDAGQISAGTTSPWVEVVFANTGNGNLTGAGLSWNFNALTDGLGNSLAAGCIVGSTTILPDPLLPNQTGRAFFRLGPIPAGQKTGWYCGSPQTLTDGGMASDFCEFTCKIGPGGPQAIEPGSAWQELNPFPSPYPHPLPAEPPLLVMPDIRPFPVKWTDPTPIPGPDTTLNEPTEMFLVSAFVCPGTGTARLAFRVTDDGGNLLVAPSMPKYYYLDIEANLPANPLVVPAAPHAPTHYGITEVVRDQHPQLTYSGQWYRVYMAFPFVFDYDNGDRKVFLELSNVTAPMTNSNAVWFDGVQMEKAKNPTQPRPTAFAGPMEKQRILFSPSEQFELKGEKWYSEW